MPSHAHQLVVNEGNNTPNPTPEKLITVSCTWVNIFSVDTASQTFEVDLVVRLRWTEPASERILNHFTELKAPDGRQYNVTKRDFIDNAWDPQLQFPNCKDDASSYDEWVRLERAGDQIKVCWSVHFHGAKFTCVFDLRRFPFDQQALEVRVSSTWDEKKVQFRQNPVDPVLLALDDYNLQDYDITVGRIVDVDSTDPRDLLYATRSDAGSSTSGARYSSVYLLQGISRAPGFYLINLYLPVLLISSSSFASFSFVPDDFGGRSNIVVTLLLTIVAFKQVMGLQLPQLPYITYLDRYILAALGLVVVHGILMAGLGAASICVYHPDRRPTLCGDSFLGATTPDPADMDEADFVCLVVTAGLWLLYQGFEMVMMWRASIVDTAQREVRLPASSAPRVEKKEETKKTT